MTKPPVPCMKVSVHLASSGSPEKAAATDRRRRRGQQQGEAPKGEEDEQAEANQDTEQFDGVSAHDASLANADSTNGHWPAIEVVGCKSGSRRVGMRR